MNFTLQFDTVTMSAFLQPFFVFRTVIHGWVAGELKPCLRHLYCTRLGFTELPKRQCKSSDVVSLIFRQQGTDVLNYRNVPEV